MAKWQLCLQVGVAVLLTAPLWLLPAAAQQVQIVGAATVIDASGQTVGTLADTSKGSAVFLRIDDAIYRADLETDGFTGGGGVSYTTPDCSGTPYIDPNLTCTTCLVPRVPMAPPGHTLYRADPNATPSCLVVGSQYFAGGFPECNQVGQGTCSSLVRAVAIVDLDTLFTPPFHVVPLQSGSTTASADCNGDGTVASDDITCVISRIFAGSTQFSLRERLR